MVSGFPRFARAPERRVKDCADWYNKAVDEGRPGVTGHRHGSRTRSLTGTFGPIEIAVPRARLTAPRARRRMEEPGAAGLSTPYAGRRCADRHHLLGPGTNTRRVRRAL